MPLFILHIEADLSPCGEQGAIVPLAQFFVQKPEIPAHMSYWHEQYGCPWCGKIWSRLVLLDKQGLIPQGRWSFWHRDCNSRILDWTDYCEFPRSASLNRQQKEFLIDEYLRDNSQLPRRNSLSRDNSLADVLASNRELGRSVRAT